ncbi:SOS response-associated peptidase [Pedobacter sp. UC225_61]|uniref:SOS response-associated peptidase n=1 Tax=Pedobacter sp. UC225_61 TaxID=3374623 RepID=UPI003796EE13
MCARYTLTAEEKELISQGNYTLNGPYVPDPNIAITDIGYVVTMEEPDVVQRMFWGIVPANATSKVPEFSSFNIVSEEVWEKPVYAKLLHEKKFCIVFADGFMEAEEVTEEDRRPWRFLTERKIFAFLGLWSEWIDPETGEAHRTYGIFTCKANKIVGEIHAAQRMPVILSKKSENIVLSKKSSIEDVLALCVPYPDQLMNRYRQDRQALAVSTKKKWNKSMELLKEVRDEPRTGNLFGDAMPPVDLTKRTFRNTKKKQPRKPGEGPPPIDLFNSL